MASWAATMVGIGASHSGTPGCQLNHRSGQAMVGPVVEDQQLGTTFSHRLDQVVDVLFHLPGGCDGEYREPGLDQRHRAVAKIGGRVGLGEHL